MGRFGWEANGISNPELLHSIIKPDMLRRTKEQAAPFLPAKNKKPSIRRPGY